MPMLVLAVKSFESSTSALAGSQAAQHSVIVLPCACAGVVVAPIPNAATPPAARSTLNVFFMRISLPVGPAIDMARRSCPLESFEQCDTVLDELYDLNRRSLALADSWDPYSSICLVNHGLLNIASELPAAAERVAGAIVTSLFREDIDHMRRKVEAYNEPEL